MKICKACNVKVSDSHEKCPLCSGELFTTDDKADPKPFLPSYSSFKERESSRVVRSVRLLILVSGLFSLILNILRPKAGFWSLAIIVCLAAFWWWLSIAIKIKRNIIKKFSQMVLISGTAAIIADFLLGWHKWSITYVVPILISSAIAIIMIVDKVMKLSGAERVFYSFLLVIIGLLFSSLMLTDIITFNIPSYILLLVCLISICHSLIFDRAYLVNELQKRFHI